MDYSRQAELNLQVPESILCIGLGGIGSWVALNFALVGTKKLDLIDADTIEEHNLNRTPFKLSHIGQTKVLAVLNLIKERREDCQVNIYPLRFEMVKEMLNLDEYDLIVDCTDNLNVKSILQQRNNYIKLGYDGFQFTIDPSDHIPWGEDINNGYRIVPSFLGTPQFLANFIVAASCIGLPLKQTRKVISWDLQDMYKQLLGV